MAANRTDSHVCIDDVTADKDFGMNSEVFPKTLLIASELSSRSVTVQMDNDVKHVTKVLKAKKWNVMQLSSQSTDLNPIEHEFHFLKTRLKGKGQAGSEDSCSNVLQSITRNKIW